MRPFHTRRPVLFCLYAMAMGKAFLRYRNPRRREVDHHRVAFYECAWREAAEQLHCDFHLLGDGIAEISCGQFRTRVMENTCSIDDPVTLALVGNKPLTYAILAAEGIPVPRHRTFTLKTLDAAVGFINEIGGDCVVKPARGTGGGRGISSGIRTPPHLARAAATAAVYGDDLLIDEQIAGDNYRLLYLDGELIDAFLRRPPTVIGDGRSTVARLIRDANEERHRQGAAKSQTLMTIDLDARRTLARQRLNLSSIPARGEQVVLKTVVNENCGRDNSTATHLLCPQIIDAGRRAATASCVRLAGVDVVTKDPAVPLEQSGGVVLEVNGSPNFYYHYHKIDGVFPVAIHLLQKLVGEYCQQEVAVA